MSSSSFSSSLFGTSSGIVRVIDYRLAPGGRWRKDLVEGMQTSFEEYAAPTTSEPEVVVADAGLIVPAGAPDPAAQIRHH